jgi:hypothetical protein
MVEVVIKDIMISVIAKPSFPFKGVTETINMVLNAVKINPRSSGAEFFKVGRHGFCGEITRVLTGFNPSVSFC